MRCDYIHCIYYYTICVCTLYTYVAPPEFHIMSGGEEIDSSESLMEAFTPELK